ncbi:helix-turn-helix domain-containing protein [Sphingobacterium siyangense]|uniref:helix-turn-helix domain-containing protein n=1 Tax=Sphingobacterium siyangense TaxID=459529 RepID=UPI003DA5AF57
MLDYQKEKIIERFKFFRRKLNKSQLEMAEETGVKKSTISAYEVGTRPVSSKFIMLLEKTYNLNRDWLIDGVGEMTIVKNPYNDDYKFSAKEELAAFDMQLDEADESDMFKLLIENLTGMFEKQKREIADLRDENVRLQKLVAMFNR